MRACVIAFTSAVLLGEKVGRNVDDMSDTSRGVREELLLASGGPIIVTTSGSWDSSVVKMRDSCSRSDLRGSTFVGERQVSRDVLGWSPDEKLRDCFCFLALLGVLLLVRNKRFFFSTVVCSFSFGGLPVFCGSDDNASGSVLPAPPSLPELSFFQSPERSNSNRNEKNVTVYSLISYYIEKYLGIIRKRI